MQKAGNQGNSPDTAPLVTLRLVAQHLNDFLNTLLVRFNSPLSKDLESNLLTVIRDHPEARILELPSFEFLDVEQ